MSSKKYFYALGRRKQTTATVKLYPQGKGEITVIHSKKPSNINDFFGGNVYLYKRAISPFLILGKNELKKYDAVVTISGGGINGIAESIKLGFSRALVVENAETKKTLKPYGLLGRDSRVKERKKPGLKKARKKPKRSKR